MLNSWKEIAAYMGRGVRTVQRWEQELGLPVRRPRGKERSAVIALKMDLDKWLQHTPQGAAPHEANFRVDHVQLRRNTALLLIRTAEVLAQSKKLQAKIAQSVALAAALNLKRPAKTSINNGSALIPAAPSAEKVIARARSAAS